MRDHVDVATSCLHGLEPSSCLICKTLATKPDERTASAAPRSLPTSTNEERGGHRPVRFRFSLAGAVVLVIAAALLVWVVAAALWTTFRVVELALVAAAGVWVGWRLGVWHGRRIGR